MQAHDEGHAMKTFYDYWCQLCSKNPQLADGSRKMTISVASFEKQLRRAYEAGTSSRDSSGRSKLDDLFRDFGGMFK